MQERLERRLAELMGEREAGHKVQAELQAQQTEVEQTLLRISGAIQVLEELLDEDDTAGPDAPADDEPADDEPTSTTVTAAAAPSSPVPPRPTPPVPPPPVPGLRPDGDRPVVTPLGDT
jgi:hypothetical protein